MSEVAEGVLVDSEFPSLGPEQRARIDALRAAREVLGKRGVSVLAKSDEAVDALDLVNVASWIITGVDPWDGADEDES